MYISWTYQFLFISFIDLPELQCSLSQFIGEQGRFIAPGSELHPPINRLILPWSGIDSSWQQTVSDLREDCFESVPGSLVLSPAPGEKFDLTIQLSDQLLNYVTQTVYIEVCIVEHLNVAAYYHSTLLLFKIDHDPLKPPGVLIQLHGIQYAYTDRYPYHTLNIRVSWELQWNHC